jgi:hypothetical protein
VGSRRQPWTFCLAFLFRQKVEYSLIGFSPRQRSGEKKECNLQSIMLQTGTNLPCISLSTNGLLIWLLTGSTSPQRKVAYVGALCELIASETKDTSHSTVKFFEVYLRWICYVLLLIGWWIASAGGYTLSFTPKRLSLMLAARDIQQRSDHSGTVS